MSLTYSTLKLQILADAHRPELGDAKAADFVRKAEGIIARRLRAAEMLTRVDLTDSDRVTVDEGIYTLPSLFLEERAIYRVGDSLPLEKTALAELRRRDGGTPVRQFCPLSKTEIEFRGIPSTTDVLELIYFARPATLASDLDTNDILTFHEEIYIAAGMSALYLFTQDVELAAAQGQIANDAIEALNEQAGRLLGGGQTAPGYNLCSWSNR